MNGLQVLQRLKQAGDARAVIMITADPQLEDVKQALKQGAYDFIGKPIDYDELRVAVKNALEATQLRSENETLKKEVLQRRRAAYHDVVGESQRMQDLMSFVNKVASSEATTILIQGESGTGKDLISRAIHFESRRKDKPLIVINCSAIPETLMEAELFGHEKGAFTDAKAMKKGLFEQADGGTLFLDEIGELSGLLASQTAARAGRAGHSQSRRRAGSGSGCARDCRQQPRSGARGARGNIPPGSVLPLGDHLAVPAAAARSPRRHSAAGALLHRALQPALSQVRAGHHP